MHPAAIGPFKIERDLGRGGMGEVYLARDTPLDRRVPSRTGQSFQSARSKAYILTRCAIALGIVAFTSGCSQSRMQQRVVASLPSYTEGIVFDAHGAAFASVQNNETVVVIRGSAPPAAWYRTITPNGHKVLQDGTHLIAARGGIHHVDAEGKLIEVLAPHLVTPNDLALDGDGGVYITVPAESDEDRKAGRSGVYYLDSRRAVHKVAGDFCYPNGLAVRPDGKTLLVNDSCNRRIDEFQITSPGILSGRRIFAEVPNPRSVPDGMTLDQAGRIYMADYGTGMIVVIGPSGAIIREIATGLEHASNVAFGGDGLTDLYVTGSLKGEPGLGQLVVLPLRNPGRSALTLPASIRE